MPWFKVDDSLAFHAKFVALPLSAAGLWMRAGAWCAQQLTDGVVPTTIVRALGGDEGDVEALVEARLWRRTKAGLVFHDWADYQPTAAAVKAEREAAAERMRELRSRRKNRGRRPDDEGPTSAPTVPPAPPGSGPSGSTQAAEERSEAPGADDVHDEDGDEGSQDVRPNTDRTFDAPTADPVRLPRPDPTRPDPARRSVETSREGGSFRDVSGREAPGPRCRRHSRTVDPPPCGACAEARKTAEAAERGRREARPVVGGATCPEHPDHPAGRCPVCAAAATPRRPRTFAGTYAGGPREPHPRPARGREVDRLSAMRALPRRARRPAGGMHARLSRRPGARTARPLRLHPLRRREHLVSTGPEIARAILRARFGPRAKPAPETAEIPCSWCGAAPGRPCRVVVADVALPHIHDVRRRALQLIEEARP